jgi:hypothetical protein
MNWVTTVSDTSRVHVLRTQLHQWTFPMGKETLKETLAFVYHRDATTCECCLVLLNTTVREDTVVCEWVMKVR